MSKAQADKSPPHIPAGWSAEGWANRLEALADACTAIQPSLAAQHRADAKTIRDHLRRAQQTPRQQ